MDIRYYLLPPSLPHYLSLYYVYIIQLYEKSLFHFSLNAPVLYCPPARTGTYLTPQLMAS